VTFDTFFISVSAFANSLGSNFYFGAVDDGKAVRLTDLKATIEQISKLIRTRISPLPEFNLKPHQLEDSETVLALQVLHSETPPYYYVADGLSCHFKNMNYNSATSAEEVSTEVKLAPEKLVDLVAFCVIPRSRKEMQYFCGIRSDEYFRKTSLIRCFRWTW